MLGEILFSALLMLGATDQCAGAASGDLSLADQDVVVATEADWAAQEVRAGREAGSQESLDAALKRGQQLLASLASIADQATLETHGRTFHELAAVVERAAALPWEQRLAVYHRLRWTGRQLALSNPLWAGKPLVFVQRKRFICQMLHEYIGYYYNYANLAGGGVFVLSRPGYSFAAENLIEGRLPRGAYATPALSYDGATVYFAFAEVQDVQRNHRLGIDWTILPAADQVPQNLNYFSPDRVAFHLYCVSADGHNLRQLTEGPEDDFDPCPLPDGRLMFMSSRRGGFCRCDNPFEPIPTHTLHSLDPASGDVQTLSWHETNEWHPSVLNDGRVVYCRWDYVDRSAAHFHGLWASYPDGSNPTILFGNYTQNISACFQPRAVPNSNKIVFVAGAHHANVGGSLVLFDPTRTQLDPETGEDRFESLQRITPDICFPETSEGWPKSFYESPWPLSEDHYLAAFSSDPLPGMGSDVRRDSETGLYYCDRFGNLELLFRAQGICSSGPIPLAARPRPPVIPSVAASANEPEGEFILADVRWSLLPLPADRPVKELRIYQVLPKETTHIANRPRIGVANAESARMLLGSVPVEADGSAYFRAPARRPLYFQSVDAEGRAIQSMRSITYLQPGERRGCIGCHETPGSVPPNHALLALQRLPSRIEPGPDGTRPLSFPRLVQGVLDRHCVRCHDGSGAPETFAPDLTGAVEGDFTRSYSNLRPHVRWYEWGGESISEIVTRPGQGGADESPLLEILQDDHHRQKLELSDSDLRRLFIWLDANAPFYGTYRDEARSRQLVGEIVDPPLLQ
ncbi:MAG: HzsA-related protein [Pirellulaceae bacterium]